MHLSTTRLSVGIASLALAGGGLVALSAPALAASATSPVTFHNCDVRTDRAVVGSRVGQPFTWTPQITVEMVSPIRVETADTAKFWIDKLPAGVLGAEALSDVEIYSELGFDHLDGSGTILHGQHGSSAAAGQPLLLGESEWDVVTPSYSQHHPWAPISIELDVYGTSGGEDFAYFVQCHRILTPATLMTVAVFDPDAMAQARLARSAAQQGAVVGVTGRDFAAGESVTAYLGNARVGAFTADVIGSLAGSFTVPAIAKPGRHQVRLVGAGGETAATSLAVSAVKAQGSFSAKKVRRGKKATVVGQRFAPGERVLVSLVAKKKAVKGKKSQSMKASATAAGTLSKRFTVKKKLAKGKYKVSITGLSSGRTAPSFTVTVK